MVIWAFCFCQMRTRFFIFPPCRECSHSLGSHCLIHDQAGKKRSICCPTLRDTMGTWASYWGARVKTEEQEISGESMRVYYHLIPAKRLYLAKGINPRAHKRSIHIICPSMSSSKPSTSPITSSYYEVRKKSSHLPQTFEKPINNRSSPTKAEVAYPPGPRQSCSSHRTGIPHP